MIIESPYDVGQKLWALYQNKAQEFTIETIETTVSYNEIKNEPWPPSFKYKLRIGESAGYRRELYDFELKLNFHPTKEELLKTL